MDTVIDKRTYRTKVYAYLRERIIAGELHPGETITLRGLSTELGVSIAPVREALVQLESEKVILRRDNRDYRVNTLSRGQFAEILSIRRMLEPHLGERACRMRPDSAVADVRRTFQAMRESFDDVKRFLSLNHDLHFSIYAYAECPILLEIVNQLWARVGPYFALNLKNSDITRDLDIHAAMVDSFARKDPKGFNRMLLSDMEFGHGYVSPVLDREEAGREPPNPPARRRRTVPRAGTARR